jgi:hypothetical protein
MTTDTRDPVTALATALGNAGYGVGQHRDVERLTATLAEQGYVLVNAEGLAAALRFWAKTREDEAAAILAAIQEQGR